MKAISADTAESLPPSVVPTMAMMNWHTTIPTAPQINNGRRPKRSTVQKEIGVEQTLTKVVINEIRNGLEMVPMTG